MLVWMVLGIVECSIWNRLSVMWQRTRVTDMIECISTLKCNLAGHVIRMKDNRWMKRLLEWRAHTDKHSKGRPPTCWNDNLRRTLGNWIQTTQNRLEWSHEGELFPAVDVKCLDDDDKVQFKYGKI